MPYCQCPTQATTAHNTEHIPPSPQVSLRLSRLIGPSNDVTSIIRDPAQAQDIIDASAKPLVLDVVNSPVGDFTKAFQGTDVVYWSCGAGGLGWDEATKRVDYEGALKVYDAIEAVDGPKPRLIVVSAVDIRDPDTVPAHYVSGTAHPRASPFAFAARC